MALSKLVSFCSMLMFCFLFLPYAGLGILGFFLVLLVGECILDELHSWAHALRASSQISLPFPHSSFLPSRSFCLTHSLNMGWLDG